MNRDRFRRVWRHDQLKLIWLAVLSASHLQQVRWRLIGQSSMCVGPVSRMRHSDTVNSRHCWLWRTSNACKQMRTDYPLFDRPVLFLTSGISSPFFFLLKTASFSCPFTHVIFCGPRIKINWVYYRDVLLKQEMLPDIRANSGDFTFQQDSACTHRPTWLGKRSRYRNERLCLSLLQICDLPTAPTSTLLTARCRTVFIRRRCETLTIWSSVWLTCGTGWSKASSMTRSTRGVHDFVPVSCPCTWGTFWTVFVTCIWNSS